MAEVNSTTIDIANNQDWDKLIDRKLTTVVDPMVFRAGEIFMRGSSGKAIGDARRVPLQPERARDFLDKNLLALGFFFDALILNDQLPVFNYGDTFDMRLNFDQRSFTAFNDAATPALVPVDVNWTAYMPIKERALAALKANMSSPNESGGPWLPHDEAQAISNELSHVEFQWDIALGPELEALLPTELDRRLGRFLLGGLIFGEYADHMKSEHWLQPKRARLFVQALTSGRAPDRQDEEQLFAWLAQKYQLPALSCWQPTFLHYILEQAKSLRDIPRIVDKLRRSGPVVDYRAWRAEVLNEWRTKGGVNEKSLKTIERLKHALTTTGGGLAAAGDAAVAWVETAAKQSPESAAKAVQKSIPLLSWMLDALPGRRHVKLLANSLHARDRYPHIERSVMHLWGSL